MFLIRAKNDIYYYKDGRTHRVRANGSVVSSGGGGGGGEGGGGGGSITHGRQLTLSDVGPRTTPSGTTYNTRQTISSSGTYSGFTYNKGLTISADNVIIEDCIISDDNNADFGNLIINGGNVTIRYCEIDNNEQVYYGIAQRGGSVGSPNTFYRNNIHHGGFGMNAEDTEGWSFYENYVHDLVAPDPAPYPGDDVWHTDCIIAWGSHCNIERNKLLIPINQTGIINFGTWSGSTVDIDDVFIDSNYMAGAGFIFYVEEKDSSYNVTNMVVTNNDIGQDYYSNGGYNGLWYGGYPPTIDPTTSGNRLVTYPGGSFVSDANYPY